MMQIILVDSYVQPHPEVAFLTYMLETAIESILFDSLDRLLPALSMTHKHAHTHAGTHALTHERASMHLCMYVYMCICARIYIHI